MKSTVKHNISSIKNTTDRDISGRNISDSMKLISMDENSEYIEYMVIRSTQQIPQIEAKNNFLCSFEIDYFKNHPRSSTEIKAITYSNKFNYKTLDELGLLANKVHTACGIGSKEEIPKYIYVLENVTEGEKLFIKLIDINLVTDAFRFNPIQQDKIDAIEEARYLFMVAKIGFMGFYINNSLNIQEIEKKIQMNFSKVKSTLDFYLHEKCVPQEASGLISAFDYEIKNCLKLKSYPAIEDALGLLCQIYFRIPSEDMILN